MDSNNIYFNGILYSEYWPFIFVMLCWHCCLAITVCALLFNKTASISIKIMSTLQFVYNAVGVCNICIMLTMFLEWYNGNFMDFGHGNIMWYSLNHALFGYTVFKYSIT